MQSARLDVGSIKSYEKSAEGFLSVYLTVSRIGDLHYQRSDGTVESEFLSEKELFNEDSLASLVGKPITLNHPKEPVNSSNIRQYIRGSVSHKVVKDSPFLTVLAVVHDQEAVKAIEDGSARQVSAGYVTELVKDFNGRLCQTNRKYNHISLVPVGRAGSEVKVHLDSFGDNSAIQVDDNTSALGSGLEQTISKIAKCCEEVTMELSNQAMMNLKSEAQKRGMSVDDFVVSLIEKTFGNNNSSQQDSVDIEKAARQVYIERMKTGKLGR